MTRTRTPPCAPYTKGTAWSGEWPPRTRGTAGVSGSSGVQAAQGHHLRNGEGGCSERPGLGWGAVLPFRLQLLSSVQERVFCTAGPLLQGHAPGAENPLFPATEQKAPLSLPEVSVCPPAPAEPGDPLSWALGPGLSMSSLGPHRPPQPPNPGLALRVLQAWTPEPCATCSRLHPDPRGWL